MHDYRYFIIYKPFRVLTQFSTKEDKKTLADYFDVPKNVYAVGRLDYDSEGLLILTNDTALNHRLLTPQYNHEREYRVQVEGSITKDAIDNLQKGVVISIDGKQHKTLPCKSFLFIQPPLISERNPPIRFRKNIAVSWISLTLTEGKNRQVRKMTAKVGYPTLRLIRYRIEKLTLENMHPGDIKELTKEAIYKGLFT